jgi:hypothetical protein
MQSITMTTQNTLRVQSFTSSSSSSSSSSSRKVNRTIKATGSIDVAGSIDADDVSSFVSPKVVASKQSSSNPIFSETAQLINGRAAMVGFVSAVAGEVITKKEAINLLFPEKIVSGVPTHIIDAQNFSLFAFTIAVAILGTITPKFTQDNFDETRQFAMFKTNSEMLNGRAAMIGIVALLAAEKFTGSPLF